MSYLVSLVNFPSSSIEDKRFSTLEAAVEAAKKTGFECAVWEITVSDVKWVKRVSPI